MLFGGADAVLLPVTAGELGDGMQGAQGDHVHEHRCVVEGLLHLEGPFGSRVLPAAGDRMGMPAAMSAGTQRRRRTGCAL